MDDHRLVVGRHVACGRRDRRARRQPPRAGHRIAVHAHQPGAIFLQGDHLQVVDREELAQRVVKAGQHARLVERRRHCPGDAVQRLEATGLVSSQLVEGRVGEQDAQAVMDLVEEGKLGRRHSPLAIRVVDHAADELALVHHRDPDRDLAPDALAGPLADLLA